MATASTSPPASASPWTKPAPGSIKAASMILGLLIVPGIFANVVGGTAAGITVGISGGAAMAFGTVLDAKRSATYLVTMAVAAAAATAVAGEALPAALVVGACTLLVAVANSTSAGILSLVPVLAVVLAAEDRGLAWWQAGGWALFGGLVGLGVLRILKASAPPKPMDQRQAWKHAIVLAIAAAVTLYIAIARGLDHGYWVPLTLLVALRPMTGERREILRARLWGTLLGAVIALVVVAVLPPPWPMAAAVVFLVLLAAYAISGNYFLQTAFLTPMLLLFASAGSQDKTFEVTLERVGFTVVGVLIAALLVIVLGSWDSRDAAGDHPAPEMEMPAPAAESPPSP